MDYLLAAIMFNIQILPETLMCGLIIMAIILANPAIVTLAAGTAGAQLLTRTVGNLLMKFSPDAAVVSSSMDMCRTGYVGKSWERLLRGATDPSLLFHPKAPSVYQATVGFLIGWGAALNQLYKEEISAGAINQRILIGLGITSALVGIISFIFRYKSGCEGLIAAAGGLLFGLALGYFGAIAIGYATNRRLTNIWGVPLLRDRINNGSAIYICPQQSEDNR